MEVGNIEHGLSQKTKDKLHYGTAGFLILSAVILAFVSFIITLTIGTGVIAWGGLCMGTALTLIGGGMYFHNQLVTFETNANRKMEEMSEHIDNELERRGLHHPYSARTIESKLNKEEYGTEGKENS